MCDSPNLSRVLNRTYVVDEEVECRVEAGEEGGEAHEDVGDAAHHARVARRGAPQLLVQVGYHLPGKQPLFNMTRTIFRRCEKLIT